MSASTLRSSAMFAFFSPAIRREYETPLIRAAALIRAIQSERKSRRRTRRPRADCIIARSPAAGAGRCGACGSCCCLLRQPVRQGLLQVLLVPAVQDQRFAEAVLPLAVLAQGQVVPAEGLARLDLARPRHAEALDRAPFRLQLRHLADPSGRASRCARAAPCTRAAVLRQAFGPSARGAAEAGGG